MSRKDADRGTGRTTKQMQAAPLNAVFVWCNQHLDYPKKLARRIGRDDLKIVAPNWLDDRWMGVEILGLVIDHAAFDMLTQRQQDMIPYALTRVRPAAEIGRNMK